MCWALSIQYFKNYYDLCPDKDIAEVSASITLGFNTNEPIIMRAKQSQGHQP